MQRGGARIGAGRPSILRRVQQRHSSYREAALYAADVLSLVVDESRAWQRVFKSEDDRVVLDALKFLVSMRDGRPAQQIHVTSSNFTFSTSDVEKARAVVAEIRGDNAPKLVQTKEILALAEPLPSLGEAKEERK